MTSWTRNGIETPSTHNFAVKLTSSQWTTINNGERAGYDTGGPLHLVGDIFAAIKENDNFKSFVVGRRATRTMFVPEILIEGEMLPEYMTTAQRIGRLGLGPQYDMFISFSSKEEATLFKLSFRGDVNVGFQGIN